MSDAFHLGRYLDRIGHKGPVAADLATLSAIHAAHVDALPFEAIDPFLRRPVELGLGALQTKMIEGRRGGYCFEHNILLQAALRETGFEITGLTGRVRWMSQPDSPPGPRAHMLLKADLSGGSYIVDAGFGACVLDAPLKFEMDIEQRTALGTFRLTQNGNLHSLHAKRKTGWRTMYVFDLEPQIHADYELGNWYSSTHAQSRFLHGLIVERAGRTRRYKLVNRRLTIEGRDGEIVHEHEIETADEYAQVLGDTFNILIPILIDQNPCAQFRSPMDMIRQG